MSPQPAPSNPKSESAEPQDLSAPAAAPGRDAERETHNGDEAVDADAFTLPDPDPDNITVLTNKLPNKPILPWNRYDSPGKEDEDAEGSGEAEIVAEPSIAESEGTEAADDREADTEELEIDEVE